MTDPKALLRVQLRKEYEALEYSYKKCADADLIHRLKAFSLYRACNRVFVYASVGNEIDTHALIHDAFSEGKAVFLPKCHGKGIMNFYRYTGELTVGRFGIPEPTDNECVFSAPTDLMIVPGLAFTKEGIRMGQGGGYYDRYLEKYPCITIGLCRDAFLKKELPTAWNDLPVDYVITETTVYECKNGAS